MNNAAKILAIETAASESGVSVQFYNSTSCALGRGNVGEPDRCLVSSKNSADLAKFRNVLTTNAAMIGSKISKTSASAGYRNLGVACDVSYSRMVTL